MGCASSTPMVATAGSEMLKAASHVKQKGEAVVEDASETLTTTLDTAKETVGTAVAGITTELGNAFKEGSQALDEAKHKVMEGLHLEEPRESESKTDPVEAAMSSSRAPTPKLQEDTDSLKTSTPEPEIERALANEEESPPTPKPSLEEMALLSAEVSQASAADAPAADAPAPPAAEPSAAPATDAPATEASAPVERRKVRRKFVERNKTDAEEHRPSTTEWEKFADQLAKSKKFKPYESFAHGQNKFSVYQDHTSLRDKPNHYDGHFSGGNSQSASQSDLSSGHITPAPTRRGQREFAKFVGSEQAGSISRSSSRLSNPATSRTFDFNPQRERISLSVATRIGSGIQRAPAERISGWGRGRPAPLMEEPGYGRRMSTGVIQPPLRPGREKFLGTASRRSVKPITPTRDVKREKSSKKQHSKILSSKESSYLDLDPRSPKRTTKTLPKDTGRSREHSFDSIKVQRIPLNGSNTLNKTVVPSKNVSSREPSYLEIESLETYHNPLKIQKPSDKKTVISREPSYAEFDSFKGDKSPWKVQALEKKTVRSREHSNHELYSYESEKGASKPPLPMQSDEAQKLPQSLNQSHNIPMEHLPQLEHSPSEATQTSTNRNQSSAPQTPKKIETPKSIASNSKMPSPPISRASSAKSSDSSNLDVIIQPMSSLNTPSIKSFTQSPDQVIMEGYEDSDLEAALARLEILRGSTATLHSLRSCSPGRHTYTASLLSSRRTSPWVMRKNYGGTVGNKIKPPELVESLKSTKTIHQTLERCDICYNEFLTN
ncbi:serine/arginine repetitive matrix protein 2 isoform X1 [Drosophila teissieri]|uniref:serine/arginine repetitive matrix protein 2 isoform X1 n=1 Tax=Drosophila teissieri TaxID=7243 RepID=UPI001CB9FC82|nr:serine/arginine repetitive matrix protein 2 isoform X1 [Drosophila teissieri]